MLRLLLLAAIVLGAPVEAATAATRELLLEVVINGYLTDLVADFTERDGELAARRRELRAVGLALPPGPDDAYIALGTLAGVTYRIDESSQTVLLTARPASLAPQVLSARSERAPPPVESDIGALLNYDILASRGGSAASLSGAADARLFSPLGLLRTTTLLDADSDGASAVRLDTFLSRAEPASLRRWRVGDLVSGGLEWSRPVRLGGIQASIDFALQPDLVTFPIPQISGEAAVPSTIDVLVNGVRQLSRDVAPGPFEIEQLPIVSGAGTVAVAVTDSQGRQTTQVLPFYASQRLLDPGLTAYSAELGAVRDRFGTASNDYGDAAGSLTWRRGLTSTLTIDAHGEAGEEFGMVGGGAHLGIGQLGVVSLAGAVSGSAGGGRGLISFGFERISSRVSATGNVTLAQDDFRDIASDHGSSVPRLAVRAALGLSLQPVGSLGLAFTGLQRSAAGDDRSATGDAALISASITSQLLERVSGYVTAFQDLEQRDLAGIMLGLTIPFGERGTFGSSVGRSGDEASGSVLATRPAIDVGDAGWQFLLQAGEPSRALAQGEYKGSAGRVTLGADRIESDAWLRAGLSGAVVASGGRLFAANRIDDSFAVVSTDQAGIGVLLENRPVGTTGEGGRLLVPDLQSYTDNRLAIDPTDVPLDASVAGTARIVRPQEGSGVSVAFPIRLSRGAVIRLVDEAGRPVPVGSTAALELTGASAPVGYDGEVFLDGLEAENAIVVSLPEGGRCRATFAYAPRAGELPEIGPVTCSAWTGL